MPHLAPLALFLALGTTAFAATHHNRPKPAAHGAEPAVTTRHHVVATPLHAARSQRRASAGDFVEASAHPRHGGHPAGRQRDRQIAQPVSLPRERRGRHTRLERVRHAEPERSPRRRGRVELPQPRQLAVISVIRQTTDHPSLADLPDAVSEPVILPQQRDARGHLLVPAALVGSHAILLHQNEMADLDGLGRVQNDADLDSMRSHGMLVSVPVSPALGVDERLPGNRRYTRPWTAGFLNDLARAHFARFHTPLQVNSAVRTVEFQQHLIHINGNAAPADGDTASPHLTGQAIDLAKRGMPLPEIAWMRGYLMPLIESGKIDVEEEFQQSCFHISVYRKYSPAAPDRYSVASRGGTSSLATLLR